MSDEVVTPRPRAGCLFLALPILMTVVIASLYFILFFMGSITGAASGERVTWTVQTCPQGKDMIVERVKAIGLGQPNWTPNGSAWTLEATLPGRDEKADKRIPDVLAQTGQLGLFRGTAANPDQQLIGLDEMTSTSFTLREMANPVIEVRLTREALKKLRTYMDQNPEDSLSIWLDDTKIMERSNTPVMDGNLIELRHHGDNKRESLAITAEWSVVLGNGPLPCDTRLIAQ